MVYYTPTPDYYQDYIEHGWLKDQAAKVHKYIERWRGKNGKWYYRYATDKAKQLGDKASKVGKNLKYKANSKLLNSKTKYNRYKMFKGIGGDRPQFITTNYGKTLTRRSDTGRPASYLNNEGSTASKKSMAEGKKRADASRKKREQQTAEIREAFNAPEVRARALKNRKNYILKENYWNPKNDKRQAQLDSYKKKGRKGNIVNRGYSNSKSGENSSAINKNSAVLKKVRQKNLTSKGYDNSKNIKNNKGNTYINRVMDSNMLSGGEKQNIRKFDADARKDWSTIDHYHELHLREPDKFNALVKNNPGLARDYQKALEQHKKKKK